MKSETNRKEKKEKKERPFENIGRKTVGNSVSSTVVQQLCFNFLGLPT